MSEQEALNHKIDRTGWDPGPWDSEPDRVDWESYGLPCLMIRNSLGNWCGYVGVAEGHKYFGKDYDQTDVSVHGGLTYADSCKGVICHVPKPGMPEKVWWLGWDAAHLGDYVPGMYTRKHRSIGIYGHDGDTYKDLAYVKQETESLAEQLSKV
jgi:hypothetical protein